MQFHFVAPVHFERWDWRSPDDPGIGGSETAVVELSRRLADRGHDVTVYAPIRDDCPESDPGGARWVSVGDTHPSPDRFASATDGVDYTQPGVWVLSRCPRVLDEFPVDHPGQRTWLVCQDVFYPPALKDEGLTDERIERLDVCLPLCPAHESYMIEVSPKLKGKTRLSSNGVKTDLIEKIEDGVPIRRDPFKLIYTSSPDRGLPALLRIFQRAREAEPRLTLTAAYGWDNIAKCKGKYWENVRKDCDELLAQPGVTWLGRLGQEALYREFLSAGLWVYPSTFTETSCISCMEAQAMGAIPITNPLWAVGENVRHGTFLTGDPANERLCFSQYVGEILRLTGDLDLQRQIRGPMMAWARKKFDWERIVDQYEEMAAELEPAELEAVA